MCRFGCARIGAVFTLLLLNIGSGCFNGQLGILFDQGSSDGPASLLSIAPPLAVDVVPLYPAFPNWNNYLSISPSGVVSCPSTAASYFSCIHGGEKLRVALPGFSSCSDLSARDELGAFDWDCASGLTGGIEFRSRGLKAGKGLRDLVTSAGFKPNRVVIGSVSSGAMLAASNPTIWWCNPVAALPANPGASDPVAVLSRAGTIYVADASAVTTGYNINADGISLVTLAGAKLTFSGSGTPQCATTGETSSGSGVSALVCAGSQKFLWIEAELDGQAMNASTASYGIWFYGIQLSRVNRTKLVNSTYGIEMASSNWNLLNEVGTSDLSNTHAGVGYSLDQSSYNTFRRISSMNRQEGMRLSSSSYNVVQEAVLSNHLDNGLWLFANSGNNSFNRFLQIVSVNNGRGIYMNGNGTIGSYVSASNMFAFLTLANSGEGIDITAQNTNHFMNVASLGGPTLAQGGSNTTFSNMLSGDLSISNSSGIAFSGALIAARAPISCSVDPATTTLVQLDNSCNYGSALQPVTAYSASFNLGGALNGMASSDLVNVSNSGGQQSYGAIADWLGFESFARAWGAGLDASGVAVRGPCVTGGICQIWDWRLSGAGSVLRNAFGPDLVNGAPCPSAVDGTLAGSVAVDSQGNSYLKNAIEIIGDGLGNDDGYCNSGEACVYAPHLGAFQGEGNYLGKTCVFSGGTVDGVRMYGY